MDIVAAGQSEQIRILHRTIRMIRSVTGVPELPAAWVEVLLVVALKPALTVSLIEKESGLSTSSIQRALLALGAAERLGRLGPGLIEDIADPRHKTRKLYFLTGKGRIVMAEILGVINGEKIPVYDAPTGREYLARFKAEPKNQLGHVDPKAFTPQTVMVGKRALLRKSTSVGPHIVAFPLAPALGAINNIEAWVEGVEGKLYRLPSIAKPDGMVIVDLPTPEAKFAFYIRWSGPLSAGELDDI